MSRIDDDSDRLGPIRMLADAFNPYDWNDDRLGVYVLALGDLPSDLVNVACIEAIRTLTRMPTVAELRAFVLRRWGPTQPPSAVEAWAEVQQAFGAHGRAGVPEWSHPLIAQAVAVVGWRRLCDSTDQTGDRIGFTRLYDRLVERAEHDALFKVGMPVLALPDLRIERPALPTGENREPPP
jgi:hypothetical protein